MKKGYIKLYRNILYNSLWTLEPFSKAQAWIDLILLTNHSEGEISLRNGEVVKVERGECGYSMITLADRWCWSRGKVKRFFDYLKSKKMIQQKNTPNATIIKLLNYEKFQDSTTNDTTNDTTNESTNESLTINDKNEKNNKENNIEEEEESAAEILKNWYGSEYKNVHLTDKEYQKLLGITLSEKALNLLIEDLSQKIAEGKEKNWSQETPNIHYARLKAYWNYRRKNPDKFREKHSEPQESIYSNEIED